MSFDDSLKRDDGEESIKYQEYSSRTESDGDGDASEDAMQSLRIGIDDRCTIAVAVAVAVCAPVAVTYATAI